MLIILNICLSTARIWPFNVGFGRVLPEDLPEDHPGGRLTAGRLILTKNNK